MNYNCIKTIKNLIDSNDLYELHSYLEFNGININDIPKDTFDPLTYAIERHTQDSIIKFLIDKYDNLNYETESGKIPIYSAIKTQNFKISDYLLKRKNGADINYLNRQNKNILLNLFFSETLTKKSLYYCLKRGMNVNVQWSKNDSVLIELIRSEQDGTEDLIKRIIKTLIFSNEFIIRLINYSKARQPLNVQELKTILDNEKSKINITKNTYKNVIDYGFINLLNDLFIHDRHFNMKTKYFDDKAGYGLILRALLFNRYDIVDYLIQYGININKIYKNIFTPLTYAAYTNLENVKIIVEHGADLDVIDGYGNTALMIASGYGKMDIIQYLIEVGANINIKNSKGLNAIMVSSKFGYFDVTKYLYEKGASLNEKTKKGDNALLLSVNFGNLSIVKFFVENGINIHEKNSKGYNALMLAAFFGHNDIVKYLIDLGMDIYETDNEGFNVIDFATKGENLKEIEFLKQYEKSINSNNNNNNYKNNNNSNNNNNNNNNNMTK